MRQHAVISLAVWLAFGWKVVYPSEYVRGFIPEDPKAYNAFPLRPPYRSYLPASKDLSEYFPPVGRQGIQSSCVGWALGYSARSYYTRREWGPHDAVPEPFSPSFIYNQTKEDSCFSGSSISAGLKLLETVGVVGLSEFPYDPEDCSRQPTQAQLSRAKKHRIKSWARVETGQLDALKSEIYLGNPVIVGLWVTPSFYQMKKGVYADVSDSSSGGHALVAVGYDDQRRAFKVINSWGENWGEKGFGWIAYDAMMKRIQNAFVMVPYEERKGGGSGAIEPWLEKKNNPNQEQTVSQTLIDTWEKTLPCTSITSAVGDNQDASLRGVVGDTVTQKNLLEWFENSPGSDAYQLEIKVRPWPQCEAIQTLKPILGEQKSFSVLINGQPEISLTEGNSVVLTIKRPKEKKYLSVFYLQADGSVVTLTVPDPTPSDAGSGITVMGSSSRTLTIAKPLGEEMVIAVASESPLPEIARFKSGQGDRDFLSRLRSAILSEGASTPGHHRIVAAFGILHTD